MVPVTRQREVPTSTGSAFAPGGHERREHGGQRLGGHAQLEPADGRADRGPGLLQGPAEGRDGQPAELAGRGSRRVEPRVHDPHPEVGDPPAVEPLTQLGSQRLLDRDVERRQQVAALDAVAERVVEAGPDGGGLDPQRQGRVAHRGAVRGLPGAGHAFDVHGPGREEVGGHAVVGLEPGGQHLLLHLAVDVDGDLLVHTVEPGIDEGVLLRELLQRLEQLDPFGRVPGLHHRLEPGRRELPAAARGVPAAQLVTDRDLAEADDGRDVAGHRGSGPGLGAAVERAYVDRSCVVRRDHAGRQPAVDRHVVAGRQPAFVQAQVGHPVTVRVPVDLEDRRVQRLCFFALDRREVRRDRGQDVGDPDACEGRPGHHWMDVPEPGLLGQRRERLLLAGRPRPVDVRAQQPVVPRRDGVEHLLDRHRPRHRPGECDDGAGQLLAEGVQRALERGTGPVQLVGEDQEGQAEPLQDPDQHPGLGLDALDRRDHQHGAVENRQCALDLGHEVGVARSVDQVHLHRPARGRQGHRGDRGADGDAAAAFDRVRVGGRVAVVDATEVPGGPGLVEESFGEGGLAGVYVRQDPQVERGHGRLPSVRSNGSAINPKVRRIPVLPSW